MVLPKYVKTFVHNYVQFLHLFFSYFYHSSFHFSAFTRVNIEIPTSFLYTLHNTSKLHSCHSIRNTCFFRATTKGRCPTRTSPFLYLISYLLRMHSIRGKLHIHLPCLKLPKGSACSALQHRRRSLPFRSLQEYKRSFRRRRHQSCPSLSAGTQPYFHQIHVSILRCILHSHHWNHLFIWHLCVC